jgi:ParB-like chromosome segregation protein Spo0J
MSKSVSLNAALQATGLLKENIRADDGDMSELLASMRAFGWDKRYPAFVDEHGTVLVGHRRMRCAKALGIDPVVEMITFGTGTDADVERVKLALISNIGFEPMTREDRKRIAEHLYGERDWTMEKVAAALGVTQRTISEDLRGLEVASKPSRPKGGRPKGSAKSSNSEKTAVILKGAGRPGRLSKSERDARDERVIVLSDAGYSALEIAAELNMHERHVTKLLEVERARRDERAKPQFTRDDLTVSQRERVDIVVADELRKYKHKLNVGYEKDVQERIKRHLDNILPEFNEREQKARDVLAARNGVFTYEQYRQVFGALHPDRPQGAPIAQEAFILFESKKHLLMSEKEYSIAKRGDPLPSTWAEVVRQANERRAAERAAKAAKKKSNAA